MADQNNPEEGGGESDEGSLSGLVKAYIDEQIKDAIKSHDRAEHKGKKWRNSWRSTSPITKAGVIFSAAVAFSTAAYSFIAFFQLRAMHKISADTGIQTQHLIDAATQIENAAWTFSGAAQGIEGNVGNAVGKLQLQADNAKSQLDLSTNQFQASQRPWIEVQADKPAISIMNEPSLVAYVMKVDFRAINIGNSIARNVTYKSFLTSKRFVTGSECEFPIKQPHASTAATSGTVVFPREDFFALNEPIEYPPSFDTSIPDAFGLIFIQCVAYTSPLDKGVVHRTRKSYFVIDERGRPFNKRQATGGEYIPVTLSLNPEDAKAD